MEKLPAEIVHLSKIQQQRSQKKEIQSIDHPSGVNVTIPNQFEVKNGMLYKLGTEGSGENKIEISIFVCRHVPIITRSFSNVERSQLYYEVAWENNGRIHKETVPAGDLAVRKDLLNLADMSLAVNDVNVRDLILYFDRFIMMNKIPTNKMVERLGHVKGNFIHPLASDGIEILPGDVGEKQMIEAFEVSGTSEEWFKEVFTKIEKYPKALLMVLSSFTSVILKDLNLGPFVVDLSGVTSKGKTTVLKVAASVWGNEHHVSEWNGTAVSFERKAAFLNSFPLMLDDSMKADERQLQRFVYNFSGGRSKGRGSISGSQQEHTWNNLMLSTGEVPLTEYAERAGGAAARILPVRGLPFDNADYEFFDSLYESISRFYGAAGLEFLKHWNDKKDDLIPQYKECNDVFQRKSGDNEVISRISRHYAAIYFTGNVLMKFFDVGIDLGWLETLFDEIMEENKAVDKPMQMLEAILTDLDAQRESISEKYAAKLDLKAIYKDDTLFLLPSYLKEFLRAEQSTIRSEWLRRGMSLSAINRGIEVDHRAIYHLGKTYRVVPIKPGLVKELGFDFKQD